MKNRVAAIFWGTGAAALVVLVGALVYHLTSVVPIDVQQALMREKYEKRLPDHRLDTFVLSNIDSHKTTRLLVSGRIQYMTFDFVYTAGKDFKGGYFNYTCHVMCKEKGRENWYLYMERRTPNGSNKVISKLGDEFHTRAMVGNAEDIILTMIELDG